MGRAPCCDKANVKRGPWSPEEDTKLKDYIEKQGTGGNWIALPQKAGLRRCGKSCRLRWLNYLRPNIKHGEFSDDEDRIICHLFANIGSRWSVIAAQLPGRTDNDIKNYWNTKLKKKLMGMPPSHRRPNHSTTNFSLMQQTTTMTNSTLHSQISSVYESGNSNYYPSFTNLLSQNLVSPQGQNGHMLVFGGEPARCSPSDGSCITNHLIGQGRDLVEQGLQSYLGDDEDFKFLIGEEKAVGNGVFDDGTLDYSLEEIKQLISTNNNYNLFVDEIKAEDKELYY